MALSQIETQALDELLAQLPRPAAAQAGDDLLAGITGVSTAEWRRRLMSLLAKKDAVEGEFVRWANRQPFDAAFAFLGSAALAFYQAEKGENPKIGSYTDAFYYIATCASVGYADIFAVTQPGKAIAAMVMIVGPSLAAKVLDQPRDVM